MYFEDQNLCKYQVVPRNILFSYQIGQQWEPSGQILSSHNSSFCKVKKSKGTLNAHGCIYGSMIPVFVPSKKSKRTLNALVCIYVSLSLVFLLSKKSKGLTLNAFALVYLYLCRKNLKYWNICCCGYSFFNCFHATEIENWTACLSLTSKDVTSSKCFHRWKAHTFELPPSTSFSDIMSYPIFWTCFGGSHLRFEYWISWLSVVTSSKCFHRLTLLNFLPCFQTWCPPFYKLPNILNMFWRQPFEIGSW